MPLTQLAPPSAALEQFAAHVAEGLSHPTQKWLSAEYLYDDIGSALFEAITLLPEYGLTRADSRLLQANAEAIVGYLPAPLEIVELGSGSGLKTRWILEAAVRQYGRVRYTPVDVSSFALDLCRKTLETIRGVEIRTENAGYLAGLRRALANRHSGERVMVLFLGSTIGNFPSPDANQFLLDVRNLLGATDSLLLGADLVKPVEQLEAAYDDPVGVTAAFNRNLLARINRELGGHFDLSSFTHQATFDRQESRVEMHLRSRRAQTVRIDSLSRSFRFSPGETIWTESSHKFTPESIREMAGDTGFLCAAQWIDEEWPFAESLFTAA